MLTDILDYFSIDIRIVCSCFLDSLTKAEMQNVTIKLHIQHPIFFYLPTLVPTQSENLESD